MVKQLIFAATLLITLGVFAYTVNRLISYFRLTKPAFPVRDIGKRIGIMLKVAFGQTKIFRFPVIGFIHALVFWGFCIILFGSLEMVVDGLSGKEKIFKFLGPVHDFIMAAGDIFALIVLISVFIFLVRRLFFNVRRFEGVEMKKRSHTDAAVSLVLILLLMVSLISMNAGYTGYKHASGEAIHGVYPLGNMIAGLFPGMTAGSFSIMYEISWWSHILLIFFFANYLPYSKHFHVFMSIPNVFLSRLDPLGKMSNMDSISREVKMMLDPGPVTPSVMDDTPERFGIKDAEDVSWKNYLDALSCTECGRCTSVCPANITGKKLSPRKVVMDVRARMKEKAPLLLKNGKDFSDGSSLLRNYISEEELWACTTCNACAAECPININHPAIILDMRRYLVLEEGSAPGELKSVFSNIENNGAPWQYSPEDRLNWARDLEFEVPVMADLFADGKKPKYLLWIGCAGAYDDRYKKVARAFVKILNHLNIDYAVLGTEETCTGDPARRAGNEMLFQMQALQVIDTLKKYEVSEIITICPHCFNTLRNEYPDLDGHFKVINYLQLLTLLVKEDKLKIGTEAFRGLSVTYHDPCYLGRANGIYDEPRELLGSLSCDLIEMKRNRSFALCCGAGGAQMFKEAEKGDKEVFIERTEEALGTGAGVIATACPFCMTMITDGIKYKNREEEIKNLDVAEMIATAMGL